MPDTLDICVAVTLSSSAKSKIVMHKSTTLRDDLPAVQIIVGLYTHLPLGSQDISNITNVVFMSEASL